MSTGGYWAGAGAAPAGCSLAARWSWRREISVVTTSARAGLLPHDAQQECLHLVAVELAQQVFQLRPLLDRLRLIEVCQERGHDVLAPAAVLIRAGAGCFNRGGLEADHDAVEVAVTALDIGQQVVALPRQRDDRAALEIFLPTAERLREAVLDDECLGEVERGHRDPSIAMTQPR